MPLKSVRHTVNVPGELDSIVHKKLEELQEFDNPTGKPGSWFEHRIGEIIAGSRDPSEIHAGPGAPGRLAASRRLRAAAHSNEKQP